MAALDTYSLHTFIAAAIAAAPPGQPISVQVPPGAYPESHITLMPAVEVEVIGGPGVTVACLYASGCSNLTFRDIECTGVARTGLAVLITSCSAIAMFGLDVHATPAIAGVMIRDSTQIILDGSEVHDCGTGVSLLNASKVSITSNTIHDISSDGVHGAGSTQVTVDSNRIFNIASVTGDHPDAIQFFTAGTTTPPADIVITNNDIRRGTGNAFQGIFLSDEATLGYTGVVITGNGVEAGMWQGIYVANAVDPVVNNNYVNGDGQVSGAQTMSPWIMLAGKTTGGQVENNVSTGYNGLAAVPGLIQSGNKTIPLAKPGDYSGLDAWWKTMTPPPPVITPPADPLQAALDAANARIDVLTDQLTVSQGQTADAVKRLETLTTNLSQLLAIAAGS